MAHPSATASEPNHDAPHRWTSLPTLLGIGAATAAAHLGNNFSTYLVGGLIDRYGFGPVAMGAWSMTETLAYAAAMFLIAPRAASLAPRPLALIASALVIAAQAASAELSTVGPLLAGRVGTGLGFGLLNVAVNLAAARMAHPARAISAGIAIQTLLYAALNLGLPLVGVRFGVGGMFLALAGVSVLLAAATQLLPVGRSTTASEEDASHRPTGAPRQGRSILAAMALFSFGSLAIWPFMERAAHAIGMSAVAFGQAQSLATLLSAGGNFALAVFAKRLSSTVPLTIALLACGTACALLTTVDVPWQFVVSLILYNVSWFITYPLVLGLSYATDPSGRLSVWTSGTWLLFESFGSLAAGGMAQALGNYVLVGWLGLIACLLASGIAFPVCRRLDRARVAGQMP